MSKLSEDFKKDARAFTSLIVCSMGGEISIACAFALAAAVPPFAPLLALGGLFVGGPLVIGAGIMIGNRPKR